jgi:uncharacterized damage-inducible protein DinB
MTEPSGVLRAMFDHHAWANGAMLDLMENIPAEQLADAAPGTYGSILSTATHLIDADERYLQRMLHDPPPSRVDRDGAELSELRAAVVDHAERWSVMLGKLGTGELHTTVSSHDDFPNVAPAEALIMVQAIHHGNEHRAQVCSAIGALGGDEAPEVSGWELWMTGYRSPDS